MATYHEKKKLWEARRRLASGKRLSRWGKTEQEAEDAADAAAGIVPAIVSLPGTVREFIRLNVWPKYGRKESNTRAQGAWAVNHYILPAIGDVQAAELQLHHVEMVLGHVREGDKWDAAKEVWIPGKKERAGSTVNTVRKHLSRVTRLMARQRLIPYNYLEEVDRDETQHEEAVLTPQEAYALWLDTMHRPVGPAIFMAGMLGLSRGEALGRTVEDVGDSLLVRTQRVKEKGKGAHDKSRMKTVNRTREIPLPKVYQDVLNSYADGRRHLCQTSKGAMHPTSARKPLLAALKRCGLPECSLQSLRATFQSGMDEIGCPRGILKEIVGHGDENVTDGYVSVLDDHPVRVWLQRYIEHASGIAEIEERWAKEEASADTYTA